MVKRKSAADSSPLDSFVGGVIPDLRNINKQEPEKQKISKNQCCVPKIKQDNTNQHKGTFTKTVTLPGKLFKTLEDMIFDAGFSNLSQALNSIILTLADETNRLAFKEFYLKYKDDATGEQQCLSISSEAYIIFKEVRASNRIRNKSLLIRAIISFNS